MIEGRPAVRSAIAVAVALCAGCAARRPANGAALADKPIELQTLADLRPPLALPTAATQPQSQASLDALETYARGRDALLRSQKSAAIKYFDDALEIDAGSALVWRDLGYAQIGRDDAKAAVAFRHALELDPTDADSRLQLARLLLAKEKPDDAVTQLRLARLSPDYADNAGTAAVVDVLLGQCLEQAHYRTAALECYENVLSVVDGEGVDLRGRPELSDVLQRPGLLVLRIADLAVQVGQHQRAIELYQRLQRQEPQLASVVELRLARAELAKGDGASATRRAVKFVTDADASVLSLAMFDELYETSGGPAAALLFIDASPEAVELIQTPAAPALLTLRSHLLLEKGDRAAAIAALQPADPSGSAYRQIKAAPTLPFARQVVHASRAAGGDVDATSIVLLRQTAGSASAWPVWQRAWEILTQPAQARPLSGERLLAVDLSKTPELLGVREFVVSTIYAKQGRLAVAKQHADAAKAANPSFDVAAAQAAPALNLESPDVSTPKELGTLIDDYRDDSDLLTTTVAGLLQAGQKRLVLDAFAAVHAARPADVVVASAYAQVLAGDDQKTQASAVLDKTTAAVRSGNELYAMASQYSTIGDNRSAERVLRVAHEKEPGLPSVCNDLGYLLADQGRELSFAEQLLTTAATAEPDNSAYLDSLGWLLYKRSKFDDAAARLEQAITAGEPVDPVVLDHAGDAFYRKNQPQKSAERWKQAVEAIKERGTADPQLRLRIEQKLRQLNEKSPVVVAPVAKAE